MDHVAYQHALRTHVAGTELAMPDCEFALRCERVADAMDAVGMDVLLATDPSDIHYLTGYYTFEVSVHCCLVFTRNRRVLQVPSVEMGPAIAGSRVDEVIAYRWEGGRNVADAVAGIVSGLVEDACIIGLDLWGGGLRCGFRDGLNTQLKSAELVDASGLVDQVRIIKSQAELELLAHSARATEAGLDAAGAMIRPGISDSRIAAAGARAMLEAGSEFMSMQPIVTAGRRSSVIHTNHRRHVINDGEPVFLEFGAAWQRYTAPMMRSVVAGVPTARMLKVHDMCRALYEVLIATMRPGATFHEAASAAERTLQPMADEVFFTGVWGYTVGVQFPPSWVEGSGYIAVGEETPFRENMVFHLPLCLRIPGVWGIGMSETVRITATGAEPITRNTWNLRDGAAGSFP